MTPLMLACLQGNATIVKVLIEKGANPNKVDILGHNSLHYCILSRNQLTIFSLLLPLMRDVNKCSRINVSPLMLAVNSGKSK